jgi:hypothetical protein
MSTAPKPRGGQDSELTKLKLLSPGQHETIWGWRTELVNDKPLTNAQIRNRIAQQFNVRLKLDKQLSQFWSWYAVKLQLAKNESAVSALVEEYKSTNPDATPEQLQIIGQTFFTALALQQQDSQVWIATQRLNLDRDSARTRFELERQKLSQSERKIVLLEKKAAAFDQAKGVMGDAALTEEQKAARMRELFGM